MFNVALTLDEVAYLVSLLQDDIDQDKETLNQWETQKDIDYINILNNDIATATRIIDKLNDNY
jgi:hypothetical protein